ncbi:MAG TPA: DNA polymerase III subunit alpha [Candidatus Atribacteria bacterium]|nr:DNA polymerase III subunit alpha [Candidatus Atribacteria bacterium]
MDMVHLHVHSQYSMQDGLCSLDGLIKQAAVFKMKAVALTDHDGLYGAIQFYKKAKSAGIKPIIGCEIRINDNQKPRETYHLILLVKNREGYSNLCQMVTRAHLSNPGSIPAIEKDILVKYSKGIIGLSGCNKGEIPLLLSQKKAEQAEKAACWYQELFGKENYYLELSFHGLSKEKEINSALIEIGEKLNIPLVATNNVHYVEKNQASSQHLLNKIANLGTKERFHHQKLETPEYYFKSPSEMDNLFFRLPQALKNSVEIAEKCNLELNLGQIHLPAYPLPSSSSAPDYLKKLCLEGLKKYYFPPSPEVTKRLQHELKIINQMGFAGYFLIVRDIVYFAKQNHIPVGPGKGSSAGSLVSYLLNITEVDPLKYQLFFERFLNPERIDLPDIDIDFGQLGRERVISYIFEKFGNNRVTHVSTTSTYAARSAIRDAGRALEFPPRDIGKIAQLMPIFSLHGVIKASLKTLPGLKKLPQDQEPLKSLFSLAQTIEGMPRHLSVHASSMIISDRPLSEIVPLEVTNQGEIVSQYEKESIKDLGLLKIDILGSRSLTIIKKTLEMLKEKKINITLDQIPLDDEATFSALQKGKTLGIFQLESSGMSSLLRSLSPSHLDDVIAALSLYRPGPLDSGMTEHYLKRKRGEEKIDYLHPKLKPILKDTYGVILYQEQVMQVVSLFACLSLGEADLFRRAISSRSPVEMERQRDNFLKKAIKQGNTREEAEKIFYLISKFAHYGFNKAHSTSYALISFVTCYLKVHYPAYYLASLLTYGMGYYAPDRYIQEARRFKVEILFPDINKSGAGFTVEDGAIRVGLGKIKGMGEKHLKSILSLREKCKRYNSLYDFCYKTISLRINQTLIENLIKIGAFDFTTYPRSALLTLLPLTLKEVRKNKAKDENQNKISELISSDSIPAYPFSQSFQMGLEKGILDIYITNYPLKKYDKILSYLPIMNSNQLLSHFYPNPILIKGILIQTRRQFTRQKQVMAFLLLEDEAGLFEVIAFPNIYQKYSNLFRMEIPLLIEGTLSKDSGDSKIIARKIMNIDSIY